MAILKLSASGIFKISVAFWMVTGMLTSTDIQNGTDGFKMASMNSMDTFKMATANSFRDGLDILRMVADVAPDLQNEADSQD